MEKLYKIIKEIKKNSFDISSEHKSITIQFNYFEGLKQLLNYEDIKLINYKYNGVCNIYKWKMANLDIDIFDYLDDQNEYNEEVLSNDCSSSSYKLIIDKTKLSSKIIEDDEINIQIYIDEEDFLNNLDFESLNYKKIEDIIFKKEKNIIFIIDSDILFYNSSILFIGAKINKIESVISSFILIKNDTFNIEKIQLRNTVCNYIDSTMRLTPNDLYFDLNKNFIYSNTIMDIIIKSHIKLVIMFISNFTGQLDNRLKSIINSNKRIEIEYTNCTNYTIENYKNFNMIYNWIYNGEPFSDKLNICRNIIGALVAAKCQGDTLNTIIFNSDRILKSLNDNLEEFTKGNIKEYFKEKSKIDKEILKDINDISNKVENIIKVFITGMTSLIGVSIAGVVGYIAKGDIVLVKILAILYILQLDINLILQVPINIINLIDINNDFKVKKEKYVNLYFGDDDVLKYEKKKKRNTYILYTYIVFAVVIIVIMHLVVYKIMKNNEFINYVLNFLK